MAQVSSNPNTVKEKKLQNQTCGHIYYFCFKFLMCCAVVEHRILNILGKHSTTELHPHTFIYISF
jgi:hypothetical protein